MVSTVNERYQWSYFSNKNSRLLQLWGMFHGYYSSTRRYQVGRCTASHSLAYKSQRKTMKGGWNGRENQRGTTEERKKEGREPHQHCQRHRQLIIFFVQQPLPFSIITTPVLHNEKKTQKRWRTGKHRERGGNKKPVDEDGITINFPFSRTRNQTEQDREWHYSFFSESQRQAHEGFPPATVVNQVSFSFLLLPFIIAQTLCRCNLITLWLYQTCLNCSRTLAFKS